MAAKKKISKPVESEIIKDDPLLPKKANFRIDEVARYFDVTDQTIRLWIDHGHLVATKIRGTLRVQRQSILLCNLKNATSHL